MAIRKGLDSPPPAPPRRLDLDVLRAQTGGDAGLEREVLRLFLAKSETDFARIAAAATPALRRHAAHGLVGSARAVGANDVARLAAAVEHGESNGDAGLPALRDALTAVQDIIRAME